MVDKRFSALAVGILTVTLIGSSAGIAHAAPLADEERTAALWYADRLKFDELHAHGATGEGIKIAVIDAAINPDVAELQGANVTVMGSYCVFRDTGEPVLATSTD